MPQPTSEAAPASAEADQNGRREKGLPRRGASKSNEPRRDFADPHNLNPNVCPSVSRDDMSKHEPQGANEPRNEPVYPELLPHVGRWVAMDDPKTILHIADTQQELVTWLRANNKVAGFGIFLIGGHRSGGTIQSQIDEIGGVPSVIDGLETARLEIEAALTHYEHGSDEQGGETLREVQARLARLVETLRERAR
jgi:hypothetical protein